VLEAKLVDLLGRDDALAARNRGAERVEHRGLASLPASARGWQVVAIFRDDGVSASKNKPEDRDGWRALLASPERFDAVVVWKVDRLARRVLDFLHADEALQERGAGIVCVEQTIDMTTAEGRGFATMLAVFGEMEAAAIAARVAAARSHLIQAGRVVGGTVPYGWRSEPNPDGPGRVLVQNAGTIAFVRGMVERVQAGQTNYAVQQWLNEVGAGAAASASQKQRRREGWNCAAPSSASCDTRCSRA